MSGVEVFEEAPSLTDHAQVNVSLRLHPFLPF